MGIKIPRQRIEQIIREELARHVKSLQEAALTDAHDDSKEKEDSGKKDPQKMQDDPNYGASPKSPKSSVPNPDDGKKKGEEDADDVGDETGINDQPEGEDPNDDELEGETEDGEEDPDEQEADAKKKLSDVLSGKSIQSLTQEPKSKVLPGAQEIVITFDNSTEPLRILVTKTGQVKFFYAGALHNEV